MYGAIVYLDLSKAAKLDEPDVRAVALETGIQSYPLILALVSPSQHGHNAPPSMAERPLARTRT